MSDPVPADEPDYGFAIQFQLLKPGTPVISADGVQLGTAKRADEAANAHIFDGIWITTPNGARFLDAPEVERIYERAVVTTFPASEAAQFLTLQRR